MQTTSKHSSFYMEGRDKFGYKWLLTWIISIVSIIIFSFAIKSTLQILSGKKSNIKIYFALLILTCLFSIFILGSCFSPTDLEPEGFLFFKKKSNQTFPPLSQDLNIIYKKNIQKYDKLFQYSLQDHEKKYKVSKNLCFATPWEILTGLSLVFLLVNTIGSITWVYVQPNPEKEIEELLKKKWIRILLKFQVGVLSFLIFKVFLNVMLGIYLIRNPYQPLSSIPKQKLKENIDLKHLSEMWKNKHIVVV